MKQARSSALRRLVLTMVLLSLTPQGGTTNALPKTLVQSTAQQRAANTVSILPANIEAEIGQHIQLKTVTTDSRGRQTEVKAGFWIALPNDLATVDGDGKVSLLAAGEVQIVAIAGGKQVRTTIRVKPARIVAIKIAKPTAPLTMGERLRLTAEAVDAGGNPNKEAKLTWESDNPRVISVDATGQATSLAAGKANITARAEAITASLPIEVIESDVHNLSLTPSRTTVRTGDVIRFTAEAKNQKGDAANAARIHWTTGEGTAIESDGTFVAQRPGQYTINASVGGKSATGVVTVTAREIARELETIGRISLGAIHGSAVWPLGKYLYVATFKDELRVYDVSDLKNPALVETLKIDARSLLDFSLTADGQIGVLTREGASNRQNGLQFLDTSDLAHPKILSSFTETISGSVHSAFIDGHYVYLTDDATGSMRVIDFHDPKNPRQVARWELALPTTKPQTENAVAGTSLGMRHLHDVQVNDGLAYLAYWRDGLVILDVGAGLRGGSPENPKLVSQFRFNHNDLYGKGWLAGTREVFRHKNYVFVGDEVIPAEFDPNAGIRRLGRGILHVIDVSDIFNPRRVAEYALPEGSAYNVWPDGDMLAMGFYGGGGRVLDISGELRGNLAEQGREITRLKTGAQEGEREQAPFTFSARFFGDYVIFNDMQTGIWITQLGKPSK